MIKYAPSTEVDFLVIGSGAAGGVMAKELSVAGFSVVVLEQGPWGDYGHEQDYNKDELKNRYPDPGDTLMSDPKTQRNTFRRNASEKAVPGNHTYGCVVGGGTVTYGGSSWRHLPWEFNEASQFGAIAGTGVADWPFTYEELEPYYTKAEWEIGISGQRVDTPLMAPMSKPYPVPPLPIKSSGALFKVAASKLGLTVVPNVAAIITENYMGRHACIECGMCSGFGCQVSARSSSAVTLLPIAERTNRCEIRAHSYVREILGQQGWQGDRRCLLRPAEARGIPEGQGGRAQCQRHRDAASAAALELKSLSAWARELERRGWQVPDERQRRRGLRPVRASAQ